MDEMNEAKTRELRDALANGGLFVDRSLFVVSPFHLSRGLDINKVNLASRVWVAPFDGLMVLHESVLSGHHFFEVVNGRSNPLPRPSWFSMHMKQVGPDWTEFAVEVSGRRIDDARVMIHPLKVSNREVARLVCMGYIQLHTVGSMLSHGVLWESFVGGHRVFRWAHWSSYPQVPVFTNK